MRKIFSMILAIVMIIAVLPVSAFATEEVATPTEVSEKVNEIPENYGMEVDLGSSFYYIEDGDLLFSSNYGRPKTIANDVTWVIEENGDVYYSNIDGHNTYIYKAGEETEVVKVFCPVECFDVDGDDVYYLYNGEVAKINTKTKEELVVDINKTMKGFYLGENVEIEVIEEDSFETADSEEEEKEEEEFQLLSTPSLGVYSSLTNFSGKAIVPLYTSVGGTIEKILNFYKNSKIMITTSHRTTYSGEIWFTCNVGDKTVYIRAADLLKYFKHGKVDNYNDMRYFSKGGYDVSPEMYKGVEFSEACVSAHSYYSQKNSSGKVVDVGVCRNCRYKYNYKLSFEDLGGNYNRNKGCDVQTTMRVEPYEDAQAVEDGVGDISYYRIDGYIINAYGKKWYRVSERKIWFKKKLYGWVHCDKIDKYFTSEGVVNTNVQYQSGNFGGQESNIVISPWNYPTGTITRGKFNLTGKITSNNSLVSVTGRVINVNTKAVALEASQYIDGTGNTLNIAGSNVNYGLVFGNLTTGTYYLEYSATDTGNGEAKIWQSPHFNVYDPYAPNCPVPTVSVSPIEYGQRVSVSCSEPAAVIHLNVDGREITGYNSFTYDITTPGAHTITAWSTNGGVTSNVDTKTVSVVQKNAPTISDAKFTDSCAKVTLSGDGDIYYTLNGKTPTKNSTKYTGPIEIQSSKTINAISTGYGCVSSTVTSKKITVKEPEAPHIKLNTESKIAQGKPVTISWNKAERATSYTAYLLKNDTVVQKYTSQSSSDTGATFVLDERNETENIDYTIKVIATNFKGDSEESNIIDVTAMHPLTVTFVDKIIRDDKVNEDLISQIKANVEENNIKTGKETKPLEDNIISVQRVDYNEKPSIPAWDDKVGLSRQYFSDEAYQKITEDTVAYAYYSVKSYSVQFWNYWRDYSENNVQIGKTQTIMYSFSAEAPTEVDAPTGYVLAGWRVDGKVSDCYDFTFVEGDMKLDTVYAWENEELPVVLEILNAKRGNTCKSYELNLKYTHYNESDTQGRIIVTLYTSDNKVVDVGVKDVSLLAKDAGFDYQDTVTVNYPDQVSKISAVMVRVQGDFTGGAISEMVATTDIEMPSAETYWGRWSEWSTVEPSEIPGYNENDFQGIAREIETKTQYRYRNKKYTTNSASSLSGWTQYDRQRTSWSSRKGPVYTNPSDGARDVTSEQYVTSSNYKKVYRYYRIANSEHALYGSASWDYWYRYNYEYDSPLDIKPGTSYSFYLPCSCYTLTSIRDWFHTVYSVNYIGEEYPAYKWVSDNYATRWYYRDPVYTYYFWKWDEWSDWSDSEISGDETDSRTVYRYRDEFNIYEGYDPAKDSQLEEATIETYNIEGKIEGLNNDYSGKIATVLVYKKTNSDPTQEQLEYVDQVILGENNSYSFVVNPKEQIDYTKTGDYIVTLSIEGCDKLATIDVIEAPRHEYTVNFHNGDEIHASVTVKEGESIDVNQIPIPETSGKYFVKWDSSVINIRRDMDINAIYKALPVSVIFVDYENETIQIQEIDYGDYMTSYPTAESVAGKTFSRWEDITDSMNVSSSGSTSGPTMTGGGGSTVISPGGSGNSGGGGITIVPGVKPGGGMTGLSADYVKNYRIYVAKWLPKYYEVKFVDTNGEVISAQDVEYGEAAVPPELPVVGGVTYSWDVSNSEWWNVTCDMTIFPYIPQTKSISAPVINASTNGGGMFYAELETSDSNEKIYYSSVEIDETTVREFVKAEQHNESLMPTEAVLFALSEDGTEQGEDIEHKAAIQRYTEPIQINPGTVVYAFAADAEGNISQISVFEFGNGLGDGAGVEMEFSDESGPLICLPKVSVRAGETVEVPLSIKNNPGTTSLSVIVGYNTESFVDVSVKNGDVFSDECYECDIRDDGSIKISWQSNDENTTDGNLAILEFTVGEEILDKNITVAVDETTVPTFGENPFFVLDGKLEEDNRIIGDVNGDGEVDFADGIRILKHDVGLIDLTGDALTIGDVNGDGEVDFADAILVLKFDVGLISSFKK